MGVVIGLHGGVDFVDIEHKSVRCARSIIAQKKTNFIGGTSRTGSCVCVLHCLKSTHHELFQRWGTR